MVLFSVPEMECRAEPHFPSLGTREAGRQVFHSLAASTFPVCHTGIDTHHNMLKIASSHTLQVPRVKNKTSHSNKGRITDAECLNCK